VDARPSDEGWFFVVAKIRKSEVHKLRDRYILLLILLLLVVVVVVAVAVVVKIFIPYLFLNLFSLMPYFIPIYIETLLSHDIIKYIACKTMQWRVQKM
jgi:hypothetical protein